MFDLQTIFNLVLQNVGFRQTDDPCYPPVKNDLLLGLQNVTALPNTYQFLLNEFVYDTVAKFDKTYIANTAVWSAVTTYSIGSRVRYTVGSQEYVFVSLQDANLNNTPAVQSAFWETDLSSYFRTCLKSTTEIVLNDLITQYATKRHLPLNLETSTFYVQKSKGSWITTGTDSKFRGVQITLGNSRDRALKLNEIQVKLGNLVGNTTVNFYLYHSSTDLPIDTFPVTFLAADNGKYVQKTLLNGSNEPCIVYFWKANILPKGSYYLGFWENDFPVGTQYEQLEGFYKPSVTEEGFRHYPIYFDSNVVTKPNSPPFNHYLETSTTFYTGFNVIASNSFDYTKTFERQIEQISTIIKYACVIRILQDEQNSNRKTNERTYSNDTILDILEDKFVGERLANKGLISQYKDHLNACYLNLGYQGGSPIKRFYY